MINQITSWNAHRLVTRSSFQRTTGRAAEIQKPSNCFARMVRANSSRYSLSQWNRLAYFFGSFGPLRVLIALTHSSTCASASFWRRSLSGVCGFQYFHRATFF